jgi:hypothetical protein
MRAASTPSDIINVVDRPIESGAGRSALTYPIRTVRASPSRAAIPDNGIFAVDILRVLNVRQDEDDGCALVAL